MAAPSSDRERLPRSIGERELIAAVEGSTERFGSLEALKELGRRRASPRRTAVLSRVVADAAMPPELRTTAAVELGREANPLHQRALVEALRSKDPGVVRRAAEGLGRIGDEEALRELKSVRTRREPVRRSVQFARTLVAYRLGVPEARIEPPAKEELMKLDRRRAVPLEVKRPGKKLLEAVLPSLRRELPTIGVSGESALRISCGDHEFLVLLEQGVERRKTLARFVARSAVAGVILKRSPSLDRYYVYEYLLTHPEQEGTLRLFGVRPTGVVAHAGEIRLEDGAARFELRAVETPYSPPVEIEGLYEHEKRRLTLPKALAHPDYTRAQRRFATPVKLELPRQD